MKTLTIILAATLLFSSCNQTSDTQLSKDCAANCICKYLVKTNSSKKKYSKKGLIFFTPKITHF